MTRRRVVRTPAALAPRERSALGGAVPCEVDLQIIEQALAKTLDGSGSQVRDLSTAVVLGLRVYARF